MVTINYRIVDENLPELIEISKTSVFNQYYRDVYGQIEMNFNALTIGFVSDDVPLGDMPLMLSFEILVDALQTMERYGYSAFKALGSDDRWIEFCSCDEDVLVSEISRCSSQGYSPFVIREKIRGSKTTETQAINRLSLQSEVIKRSKDFMSDISRLNPILVECEKCKNMMKMLRKLSV